MLSINGVQIALANGEDVWNGYRRSKFLQIILWVPPQPKDVIHHQDDEF